MILMISNPIMAQKLHKSLRFPSCIPKRDIIALKLRNQISKERIEFIESFKLKFKQGLGFRYQVTS